MAWLGISLATSAAQADGLAGGQNNPPARPAKAAPGEVTSAITRGKVSYYGKAHAGNPTASGERFDPAGMTMAHRHLPFGTWVRLTHPGNRRSVVVRVNDRGPFVPGRVADVSQAAARQLGILRVGVASLQLEVLPGPPPLASTPG